MEDEFDGVFKPISANFTHAYQELLTDEERSLWYAKGWEYYTESSYIAEGKTIGYLFLFRRTKNLYPAIPSVNP